jgi:hypothetical protein
MPGSPYAPTSMPMPAPSVTTGFGGRPAPPMTPQPEL